MATAATVLVVTAACAGDTPKVAGNEQQTSKSAAPTDPAQPATTTTTTLGAPTPTGADQTKATTPKNTGSSTSPAATHPASATTTSAVATSPGTTQTGAQRFGPPPGGYEYAAEGTRSTGSGPTERNETPPPRQVDTVREGPSPSGTRVTITTTSGDDTQETEFLVTPERVTLVRLTYRSTTTQTVTPRPPIPIAQLPYRPGATSEFAWEDTTMGIQGVGAATVDAIEDVATPAGTFTTAAVAVRQRIRGAVSGTLDVTFWVDTHTGIHARRRVVSAFDGAAGGTRSDITATLTRTQPERP